MSNPKKILRPDSESMTLAEVALQYVGKTEIRGNMGFHDKDFERRMREVGFQTKHPWCAYFAELVAKEWAGKKDRPDIQKMIAKYFSGSSTRTMRQMEEAMLAGKKIGISKTPIANSIAIFRYGNKWQGHTGVIIDVKPEKGRFYLAEGNTNDKGGREGYIVAKKSRKIDSPYTSRGLNFIGCFWFPLAK